MYHDDKRHINAYYRANAPIPCPECGTESKILYCKNCDDYLAFLWSAEDNVWVCPECDRQYPTCAIKEVK